MSRFKDDDELLPGDFEDDALDHEAQASLDDTYDVVCPYCAAGNEVVVDLGGGESQSYVEDCQVCCRPWQVNVEIDPDGRVVVRLDALDE